MRIIPKVHKEWSLEIQRLAVQVSKQTKKTPKGHSSNVISKANTTQQLNFVTEFRKTKVLCIFSVSPEGKEKQTDS